MIVVAGEALVDLAVRPGGTVDATPGGGPYNAARAIARLGVPVGFIGRISRDGHGKTLAAALAADGVDLTGVVRTDDPTTTAIAELDADGTARYAFSLDDTSAPGLTEEAAVAALDRLRPVEALHVGTLGLLLEPSATAVRMLVRRLAGAAIVLVDPNCRPAVTPDPADTLARLEPVLALADVVKVSTEDLAFLFGDRSAPDAARALLERGARVVLLTRGGDGATVITAAGTVAVGGIPVAVVDTIGAGDTFGGAFLAWLVARGHGIASLGDPATLAAATRFAVRASALTCTRRGADPPSLAELG